MTPREKAIELSIKMCNHQDVFKPNKSSNKKALIVVNEIINAILVFSDLTPIYWQEVKNELEKL